MSGLVKNRTQQSGERREPRIGGGGGEGGGEEGKVERPDADGTLWSKQTRPVCPERRR